MPYTAPYIDDAGLHIPTYADIRDDLIDTFKDIYGQDIYLDNDSQDYQMISAFALKTYDTIQLLQIIYNNFSPKTAVGTGLDSLVKLNGIARKSASYSTCVVTLTGTAGTTITAGVVEDSAGYKWDLPANITFTAETLSTTAQCETIGSIEAAIGAITKINTPQYGWTAVNNLVPAVVGDPIETNEELKERQSISVAIPSQNMVNSLIAGIASISGVNRSKVYDNDSNTTDSNGIPGHSVAAVVEGGLDANIGEQIYLRKGPGSGTYGNTTIVYTNDDGLQNDIRFFRPTYISVDANITIYASTGYSSTVLDTIKSNIESYIENLDIGYAVSITGIIAAITKAISNTARPEFSLGTTEIGKTGGAMGTGNIILNFNEVAAVGTISVSEAT
ncbi:baseplate J/gp47 family protein [Pectinatus haikarae]|uniref:Phage protein gp47/JayE n=1 Tax=Pectinatus haikarae TaxID=349096 RepID=A0ABT9Y494_9FIRM|nr:baseplate J/gp47 family protein [Pectinatus haikarae]MDQ0202468.1 putative phage protein gp47/JayE [Pectinatus haikarae]